MYYYLYFIGRKKSVTLNLKKIDHDCAYIFKTKAFLHNILHIYMQSERKEIINNYSKSRIESIEKILLTRSFLIILCGSFQSPCSEVRTNKNLVEQLISQLVFSKNNFLSIRLQNISLYDIEKKKGNYYMVNHFFLSCVLLLLLQTSYCNTLWWCVIIYPHTLQ